MGNLEIIKKVFSLFKYSNRDLNMDIMRVLKTSGGVENPANTKHYYNICTTSAQRLRRWSNIVQMLYKYFLFTGNRVELIGHVHFWCSGTLFKNAALAQRIRYSSRRSLFISCITVIFFHRSQSAWSRLGITQLFYRYCYMNIIITMFQCSV